MAINVSKCIEYNGGFLPDMILPDMIPLTQCYFLFFEPSDNNTHSPEGRPSAVLRKCYEERIINNQRSMEGRHVGRQS